MLPILFQSSDFILYSYPLLMGIGWGVAYQIYFSLLNPNLPILRSQFLFWGVFLFAWIGAKLLFYITFPSDKISLSESSFWTGGGFVFFGGLFGALTFLGIIKLLLRDLSLKELWPMIPALAIGHGIGRIGCFLAGCCYGKPTEMIWGVYMHDHFRHPTQLFEAFSLIVLGTILMRSKKSPHHLLPFYFIFYGGIRMIVESLRDDAARGQWGSFTPSEWISGALIVGGILLILINKFRPLRESKLF